MFNLAFFLILIFDAAEDREEFEADERGEFEFRLERQ